MEIEWVQEAKTRNVVVRQEQNKAFLLFFYETVTQPTRFDVLKKYKKMSLLPAGMGRL
jgi:hypothetical protein